ncbi:MAG: DsrE family protein [Xanthomonadales bacterium]|nr:DsrE family protein [Xanthomonadales bacterium]
MNNRLALLVRTGVYGSRESRAEADMALAALSLDFDVEVFFTGDAILQLAADKAAAGASLPAGYRAWSALPDLGSVQVFAESGWLERCHGLGIELVLPVEGLGFADMKQRWRGCDHVVVL